MIEMRSYLMDVSCYVDQTIRASYYRCIKYHSLYLTKKTGDPISKEEKQLCKVNDGLWWHRRCLFL